MSDPLVRDFDRLIDKVMDAIVTELERQAKSNSGYVSNDAGGGPSYRRSIRPRRFGTSRDGGDMSLSISKFAEQMGVGNSD